MWNGCIKMPKGKSTKKDKDGFPVNEFTYTSSIPASIQDATRNEEVLAQQFGYQADVTVKIMACNDTGALFFVDESTGEEYLIRRRFRKDKGMFVQLIGERRQRNAC